MSRVQGFGNRVSSTSTVASGQDRVSRATRDAFFRKSDGPRLSPRNRRTSPVDAPSSYTLMALVSTTYRGAVNGVSRTAMVHRTSQSAELKAHTRHDRRV